MNYKYIKGKECPKSNWSGGSTTELFVWPETASYINKDFSIRVSTATVELEQSTFTALPGYIRLLSTIQGTMRLCYRDHGEDTLSPYEVSRFDGGWDTVSYGKCTDFGVMLGSGWDGQLQKIDSSTIVCQENMFTGIYATECKIPIVISDGSNLDSLTVETGDMLLIPPKSRTSDEQESLQIKMESIPKAMLFTVWQSQCQ